MLNNIFLKLNISSRFENFYKAVFQKTINQQSNNNPIERITQVIDSTVRQGVKKIEKIVEDSGELIRTPTKWLKNTQTTLLIFIICLAIICLCVLIFYCVCQGYCGRRRSNNSRLVKRLEDITMTMAKNTNSNGNKY